MSKYGVQTHGTSPLLLRGGGIAKRGSGQALKSGGRARKFGGGRTNLLEELGRVEAEKSNRNRRAEIARVHSELNKGYKTGGRVAAKDGKWIQKATASIKRRGTKGVCTGKKFGGPTCRPGTKRYNLAKTFKKMARKG